MGEYTLRAYDMWNERKMSKHFESPVFGGTVVVESEVQIHATRSEILSITF